MVSYCGTGYLQKPAQCWRKWSSMNCRRSKERIWTCAECGSVLGLDTMKRCLQGLAIRMIRNSFISVPMARISTFISFYRSEREAGYRVGRYICTALFLKDVYGVNEIYIKKDALARLTSQIQSCADEMVTVHMEAAF